LDLVSSLPGTILTQTPLVNDIIFPLVWADDKNPTLLYTQKPASEEFIPDSKEFGNWVLVSSLPAE